MNIEPSGSASEEYTSQEIDEKISRGLAQLERGEAIDGDEFFERLRLRGEDLRRLSAHAGEQLWKSHGSRSRSH